MPWYVLLSYGFFCFAMGCWGMHRWHNRNTNVSTPSTSHNARYATALEIAQDFADHGNSCATVQVFLDFLGQRLNACDTSHS